MKKNYFLIIFTLCLSIAKSQTCTPTITASDTTICSGSTVTLTASGSTNYTWAPSGESSNIITVQPSSTTIYTLIASSGTCTSSSTIQINVNQPPSVNIVASSSTICAAGSTTIGALQDSLLYSWAPSASLSDSVGQILGAFPDITTTYTVIGYDGVCYGKGYFTLNVTSSPVPSFSMQPDVTPHVWNVYPSCTGGVGPYTYSWNWGDGSPYSNSLYSSHTYAVEGVYDIFLYVTDANGCFVYFYQSANIYKTTNSNDVETMVQVNVIDLTTGIQTAKKNNDDINTYPNPASDKVYINMPITEKELSVNLYDVNGKLVMNRNINSNSYIDISSIDNGVYTLTIKTGASSTINKKLIIVR